MKSPIILFIVIFAIILAGCNKVEEKGPGEPEAKTAEIVFTGHQSSEDPLKMSHDSVELAEYALITINGIEYMRNVFYIEGVPYTQSIKLPPGIYTVEQFLMKDDNQTPNDTTDDYIVFATPEFGSEYAGFVNKPVPFEIEVEAFIKNEVPIEVLYFEPAWWESFGFEWFIIEQSYIREQCFFGDICTLNPDEYAGSLYAQQANGLQIDMPAIFYIEVWQNSEKDPDEDFILTGKFSNEDWLGEGDPLCVLYEDYLLFEDLFEFKLFVLVATENGVEYTHIHTWEFADDEMIESGDDGITDFAIGDCAPDADFIFDPPPAGGGGGNTETAYAYTDEQNTPCYCFTDLGIGNNWGWQIGPFSGDQIFDLYAAAGGCDLAAGTLVGELVVNFDDLGEVDIIYQMNPGYTLEEVHLYIDDEPWPGNNIAPGQFPYKNDALNGVSSYPFEDLPDFGGTIYLIAHATVAGF